MNEAVAPKKARPPLRTGDIIGWIVVDPDTGEYVMRCTCRKEAREVAQAVGARFTKVVVAK